MDALTEKEKLSKSLNLLVKVVIGVVVAVVLVVLFNAAHKVH